MHSAPARRFYFEEPREGISWGCQRAREPHKCGCPETLGCETAALLRTRTWQSIREGPYPSRVQVKCRDLAGDWLVSSPSKHPQGATLCCRQWQMKTKFHFLLVARVPPIRCICPRPHCTAQEWRWEQGTRALSWGPRSLPRGGGLDEGMVQYVLTYCPSSTAETF